MEIKIEKITKSFLKKNLFFVDLVIDGLFFIKGMRYYSHLGKIYLPALRTEAGIMFSPIGFKTLHVFEEFINKCIALMNETPLPTTEEQIAENEKNRIRKEYVIEQKRQKALQNSMGRSPPGPPAPTSIRAPHPSVVQKKTSSRIRAHPNTQSQPKKEIFVGCGKGFTEIPLRKNGN